ncbi:MAG: uroporphyrinogen decarboxylase [Micavibrio sp.]|nr:uroporphyrinogen decarboxylase [Micavibrio sp.]
MVPKKILKVLQGECFDVPPFWFMRQAGRYLPEYRELRAEKGGFLAMAFDPKAACEITLQPIRRFQMDAAIIFSDILVVPMALGQHLEFVAGEGPKLEALADTQDLCRLSDKHFDVLDPVFEALNLTRAGLKQEGFESTALIGFAGAPWTVATYMIEGGSSKDFYKTRLWSYRDPEGFQALMDMLVETTARYLIKQVEAGAEALQIFDSWSGALDPISFEKWSIAPTKEIIARVKAVHPDVPIIGFPKGAGHNLEKYVCETGIDGVGIDQFTPLDYVSSNIQTKIPVQGNLDPFALLAGGETLDRAAKEVLDSLKGRPFIFNLGHGINKDTPPENVERLVKIIRGESV